MSTSRVWEPKEYQIKAMQFALENANCALFLGMGTGKTSVVLGALSVLKHKKAMRRALVIAPSRVCSSVWPVEHEKWEDFHDLSMSVLHGPKKDKLLEAFDHDIAVVSVDSLKWALNAHLFEQINPDVLIVDESSFIKNQQSQRFKILRLLLPRFSRRVILTGTPSPQGAMDLWSQFYTVDRGGALGQYITHYRRMYFDDVGYQFSEWQLREGAMAQINERIRPLTFRADDPEVQALLPELILNTIPVELDSVTRQNYSRLESDFFLALGDATVMPPTAAALSQKLRQMCNGTLYVDGEEGRATVAVHEAKLQALDSIVGESGGKPLLVFYEFISDRERICGRYNAPHIGGDTSPLEAAKLVAEFNTGKHQMLCVHPRSAGFGLNLQEACSEAVWFGPTWDCGVYEQAIARIYRQGQKNKHVTVHTIVVRDSVENRVVEALGAKVSSQRDLLAALRR